MENLRILINSGVKIKDIIEKLKAIPKEFENYELLCADYFIFSKPEKKGQIKGGEK